jgi:hypothetical protein
MSPNQYTDGSVRSGHNKSLSEVKINEYPYQGNGTSTAKSRPVKVFDPVYEYSTFKKSTSNR